MPWYVLGISNASGMFDISGTMLLVYWMFVYGLKSVWIPWLWPTFNQVFLMVYSVGVAAALQGHDRRGVDQDAFRHRPRRPVVAPDRCDLMPSSASSGSSPTASRASASSRPTFLPWTPFAEPIRAHPRRHHRHLCHQGRHDQRGNHRGGAVLASWPSPLSRWASSPC
jgi:hypothetical protein